MRPTVREVFVPGGFPEHSYIARDSRALEERVADYLDERYRILSVSGPTKAGKTVLLRANVERPIWLSGGTIEKLDDFWNALVDGLGLFTHEQAEISRSSARDDSTSANGGVGIPKVAFVGGETRETVGSAEVRKRSEARDRTALRCALSHLRRFPETVVVIDDFHYMAPDVQRAVIRGVKDLVFDGLGLIVTSVPHRALDIVRGEKDMAGRIEQLVVEPWRVDELQDIATTGFAALNVKSSLATRTELANESLGSPHLMQEFCRQLCKANGVRARGDVQVDLQPPIDWTEFFERRAEDGSRRVYDELAHDGASGPAVTLIDGTHTTVYGAVLAALAATGPRPQVPITALGRELTGLLPAASPPLDRLVEIVDELATRARRGSGQPVLDFDRDLHTVHLADPFFAYFLRWGETDLRPNEELAAPVCA